MASVAILLAVAASAHAMSAERQTGDALDRAREHLERGEKEAGAHRYDEAIAHYNAAIQLKPDYAEAYNDRGHAYHWKGKGNKDLAIADFTRAIALRPIYPNAYNNRGVAYLAAGDSARSIPEFDRAPALKPDFRNADIHRAKAHRRLLHYRSAPGHFHRAWDVSGTDRRDGWRRVGRARWRWPRRSPEAVSPTRPLRQRCRLLLRLTAERSHRDTSAQSLNHSSSP